MNYQNPRIPEGINVSPQKPVREFLLLTSGVFGVIAIVLFAMMYSAGYLAQFLPFSWEVRLIDTIDMKTLTEQEVDDANVQQSLQHLADTLAAAMDFPDTMKVQAHWLKSDQMNAFATLGGQIFLFSALGQELESEQGLAMVLAHEIAHVRLRHPIRNLAGGGHDTVCTGTVGEPEQLEFNWGAWCPEFQSSTGTAGGCAGACRC